MLHTNYQTSDREFRVVIIVGSKFESIDNWPLIFNVKTWIERSHFNIENLPEVKISVTVKNSPGVII